MLLPKRVKHRKQHRGRMTGRAMRGNRIAHGDFGFGAFASLFASASIPFSPFAVTPLATIPATIPAVSFPVTSMVIFCAPAPAPIEMPSLATIVAVLLNVRFPAVDACPIGIIADTANAKVFYSDTNL